MGSVGEEAVNALSLLPEQEQQQVLEYIQALAALHQVPVEAEAQPEDKIKNE